jgi:hypothetical protein
VSSRQASGGLLRSVPIGVALISLYVVVCVATLRWTVNDVRPLFEGIGPQAPYRWVNPPPEFEPGNMPPKRSTTDVELGPGGSQSAGLVSSDSQLVLNVPQGAVPPRAGDERVSFVFSPVDPADLAPVDAPLRADGNAYRVDVVYKPTSDPAPALTAPGDLLLITPEPADTILFSADGESWTRLESRHETASGGVSASFTQAGYYLAGTSRPPAAAVESGDQGYGTVVVIAIVALLAIALAWAPFILQRTRARRATRGQPRRGGRQQRRIRRRPRR